MSLLPEVDTELVATFVSVSLQDAGSARRRAGPKPAPCGAWAISGANPATNTWSTKAPLPAARAFASGAAVINGKIYVPGGSDGVDGPSVALDVYDPATNTWATKANMPTPRQAGAGQVINGKLFAAGGDDGLTVLPTLEVYNPSTNTWVTKANMPTSRHGLGTGAVNGLLYAGGAAGPAASSRPTRSTPHRALPAHAAGSSAGENGARPRCYAETVFVTPRRHGLARSRLPYSSGASSAT